MSFNFFSPFFLLILLYLSSRFFLIQELPILNFYRDHILIFDLLSWQNIFFSWPFTTFFGVCNIILSYYIFNRLLGKINAFFYVLIYLVSPWSSYLELAGSLCVFLAFVLQIFFLGIVENRRSRLLSTVIIIFSSLVLIYSSVLMWMIVPSLILVAYLFKIINFQNLKKIFLILILCTLPLLYLSLGNSTGTKEQFRREVTIFSDIGLINSVNSSQGELKGKGLNVVARVVENRYIFYARNFLQHLVSQLSVFSFFSSNWKLLGFSYQPLIPQILLIPFLLGLFNLIKKDPKVSGLLFLTFLILSLPSALSDKIPNPTKLFLVSPFLFSITSLGLTNLYLLRSKLRYKVILVVVLVILAGQLIIISSDILLREVSRLNHL